MDMLRFLKFTIGHAWTSAFGCSDKEDEFHWLIKYSPLHNVKRPWEQRTDRFVQYPSNMLLTADHDDRVVPLHTYKTMQYELGLSLENSPQMNPLIARIEVKAGDGAGRPTQKMIDEAAEVCIYGEDGGCFMDRLKLTRRDINLLDLLCLKDSY